MSASKRASDKVINEFVPSDKAWQYQEDIEAMIAAEYEPLIKALKYEIANCPNCEGAGQFKCGKCRDDVLHTCKRCLTSREALAHIEGDATS